MNITEDVIGNSRAGSKRKHYFVRPLLSYVRGGVLAGSVRRISGAHVAQGPDRPTAPQGRLTCRGFTPDEAGEGPLASAVATAVSAKPSGMRLLYLIAKNKSLSENPSRMQVWCLRFEGKGTLGTKVASSQGKNERLLQDLLEGAAGRACGAHVKSFRRNCGQGLRCPCEVLDPKACFRRRESKARN